MRLKRYNRYECDFCPRKDQYDLDFGIGIPTPSGLPVGWSWLGGLLVCPDHKVVVTEKEP